MEDATTVCPNCKDIVPYYVAPDGRCKACAAKRVIDYCESAKKEMNEAEGWLKDTSDTLCPGFRAASDEIDDAVAAIDDVRHSMLIFIDNGGKYD